MTFLFVSTIDFVLFGFKFTSIGLNIVVYCYCSLNIGLFEHITLVTILQKYVFNLKF